MAERQKIINYPPGGQIVAPKHVFTPIFCLHTVTTGSGLRYFCSFLRYFDVLIEIYPLVPFPSSVREGVSDVTADVLRWGPMTSAEAAPSRSFAGTSSRRPMPDELSVEAWVAAWEVAVDMATCTAWTAGCLACFPLCSDAAT